jgi:hypothetical protein
MARTDARTTTFLIGHVSAWRMKDGAISPWRCARSRRLCRRASSEHGFNNHLARERDVRINPALRWTSRPKQALLSTDR